MIVLIAKHLRAVAVPESLAYSERGHNVQVKLIYLLYTNDCVMDIATR